MATRLRSRILSARSPLVSGDLSASRNLCTHVRSATDFNTFDDGFFDVANHVSRSSDIIVDEKVGSFILSGPQSFRRQSESGSGNVPLYCCVTVLRRIATDYS